MTYVRNKKGKLSDPLSRSKENWERGKGARKIGNPSYKPVKRGGKKVYVVRKKKTNIKSLF
jgi:hypothetical protein